MAETDKQAEVRVRLTRPTPTPALIDHVTIALLVLAVATLIGTLSPFTLLVIAGGLAGLALLLGVVALVRRIGQNPDRAAARRD